MAYFGENSWQWVSQEASGLVGRLPRQHPDQPTERVQTQTRRKERKGRDEKKERQVERETADGNNKNKNTN